MHLPRPGHQRAGRGGPRASSRARRTSTTLLARHALAWDHLWHRCDVELDGPDTRRCVAPAAPVPPAADGVPAHRRPRRRRPGPRPARRGLPRPRLLGRALRPSRSSPCGCPTSPGRCCSTGGGGCRRPARPPARPGSAARCSPGRAASDGREESPAAAPQPALGALAARQLRTCSGTSGWPSPTTPGATTRRPGTSTSSPPRRGADPRDRQLLRRPGRLRPLDDRYDIRGVMGPDEYHDGYPWRDEPGLDDNAYTNVMAAWTLHRALDVLDGCCPERRGESCSRPAAHAARPGAVGPRQPPAAAVLARRRRHPQPVRGLRRARGVRLGRLPARYGDIQPARPHPRGRGRHAQPLQGCPSRPTCSCCSTC